MKNIIRSTALIVVMLVVTFTFVSCNSIDDAKLWEDATYLEDTEIGEGEKTFELVVSTETKSITLTVHTDKATVGDALVEYGIIEGDESEYGLYINSVNGITADYDENQSYWALYVDGEYALEGIDATKITEGVVYKLVYTK